MLFFPIRHCDTNPLAHALIERFGSLCEVFSAPTDELVKVKGIGEHTAEFIHTISDVSAYLFNLEEPEGISESNILQLQAFLYSYFSEATESQLLIACLDDRSTIAYSKVFSADDPKVTKPEFIAAWLARRYFNRFIVAKYCPDGSFDREKEREAAYRIKMLAAPRASMAKYCLLDEESVTLIDI